MKKTAANLVSATSLLLAGAAIIAARRWPAAAATFPTIVALLVGGLAAVNLAVINLGRNRGEADSAPLDLQLSRGSDQAGEGRNVAAIFSWLAGFLAAVFLLGFPPAALLFVLLYLRLEGRESWPMALGGAILTGAFIYLLFVLLLKTSYQPGWVLEWLRHHPARDF